VTPCYRCGEPKPADAFYPDTTKASGYKSICMECDRARGRAYYAEHGEQVKGRVSAYQQRQRRAA